MNRIVRKLLASVAIAAVVVGSAAGQVVGTAAMDPTMIGGQSATGAPASNSGAGDSPAPLGSTLGSPVRIQSSPRESELRRDEPGQEPTPAPGDSRTASQPSRFERYVADVVGHPVPVFGADFFERPYRASAAAPVSDDYTLGPGDEVLVRGWGSIDVDVRAIVDRTGAIHIPRVGAIAVAGVRSADVEQVVRKAVARYYRNFQLSVTLGRIKSVTVYVTGYARHPGTYVLTSLSTVISALQAAGGATGNGALRSVQLRRGGRTVAQLDLYSFLTAGDKAADEKLRDGDVVHIPAAYGHVALIGEVDRAAIYEIRDASDSVEKLIEFGGGLPVGADPRRALVERFDASRSPPRSVESVSLDGVGRTIALRDGDVVTILSVVPRFANAITLRGNVDQTLRVPFRPGMRVTDLIPSREFLLSRDSLKRLNSSVQPNPSADSWVEMEKQQARAKEVARDPTRDALGNPTPDPISPVKGDGASGTLARPGERGTALRDQLASVREERRALSDEKANAARDDARRRVQEIGNRLDPVNFDYASIERYDANGLRTRVLSFNLGRALDEPNGADNLALEAGDIVTVFSQTDLRVPIERRPAFVTIEGEVAQPGVYEVRAGDSLADVIRRAGGLTRNAYLFGAEFYREEVRRQQQVNLEKALRRIETESSSGAAEAIAKLGASDAGIAQARLQAQQQAQAEMIQRIRGMRATGRISLGLSADARDLGELPRITLENLDRLVIPSRPDFVYVYGAVNSESSFLWRSDSNVQRYLSQAGLDRYADKSEVFVIRADGSVASGSSGQNPLRGFRVMPGDNIVVPEKADKEPTWAKITRGVRDWAQILAGFGLAVAAVNTL